MTHPDAHAVPPGSSVVITGASSGIGRDATLYLSGLGYRVFAGVRRPDDGDRLRDDAALADAASAERITPVLLEVTDDEQVTAAAAFVDDEVGGAGLTAVFSNAGIASFNGDTACETCPLSTQQRVMEVNHFGAVRVIQAMLPMVRRSRGRVVVNSALMARIPLPFNAGYAASKAALEAWATSLRREVAPHGVEVILVEAAAISSALAGHQHIERVPDTGPYAAQHSFLEHFMAEMDEMHDDPRAAPRRFSEVVAHALQAPRPNTRYVVGGGSRLLDAVAHLPEAAQDRAIEHAVRHAVAGGA
jgi:NAD(P)-dependent dehydrogenase (short-subunit alcohol dehydrogenase family)